MFDKYAVIILFTMSAMVPAAAQATRTVWDGVYTQQQAARGKDQYFAHCLSCHGNELQGVEDSPSLSGQDFLSHWDGKLVGVLFAFMNAQMPAGNPGSLPSSVYTDILAFLLASNGFPAGKTPLPDDDRARAGIALKAGQ